MHLTSTFLLAALLPLSALAGWVFDPSNPGDGSCDAVCASPDNGGGKCAQEGFAFFSAAVDGCTLDPTTTPPSCLVGQHPVADTMAGQMENLTFAMGVGQQLCGTIREGKYM